MHVSCVVHHVPSVSHSRLVNTGTHGIVLASTGQVQNLTALRQLGGDGCHDCVDVKRPQGAARDDQRGQIRVKSEALRAFDAGGAGTLVGGSQMRQARDLRAEGQSDDLGASLSCCKRRGTERECDEGGPSGSQPVRQAGARILFMNGDRDVL